MLTRDNPVLLPYTPDVDPDFAKLVAPDATETRTAFLVEREDFSSRVDRLEAVQWLRTGQHPGYARFDDRFQVEYLVHHEAPHISVIPTTSSTGHVAALSEQGVG